MIQSTLCHLSKALNLGLLTTNRNYPFLSAIQQETPYLGVCSHFPSSISLKKDTKTKKKDTPLNLFKVNNMYYFRTRINYKLYRKSLKTDSLKIALKRLKLIKMMKKEELLNMFTFKDKDYELIFEYDNINELEQVLNKIKEIKQIQQRQEQPQENYFNRYNKFTFEDLELEFLAHKKKMEVSKASFLAYNAIFSKLKTYFKGKDINYLTFKDFEYFRDSLIEQGLENKTINNNIQHLKHFLEFAKDRQLIEHNAALALENLKTQKKKTDNFKDEEIRKILEKTYNHPKSYIFPIFITAIFTGMRFNEILDINEDSIKEQDNIKYIDITRSKTSTGIRKIPLHRELLGFDFSPLFELKEQEKNKYNKEILKVLYSIIDKNQGKTFHTLRATFSQKLTNIASQEIPLIMEILGHSQGKQAITLSTYSKEFYLSKKLEIINKLNYNI